jgi:hypothetical protein
VTAVPVQEVTGSPPISRWGLARVALAVVLGLLAPLVPKLSIPAVVIALLVYLALPAPSPRWLRWVVILAGVLATAGAVRFVVTEAVPGMVQGGRAATGRSAVSRLREIVFAQDSLRKRAVIDPDRDGIGSAAWLGELSGVVGVRGGARLEPPILGLPHRAIVETRIGPAAESTGYLVIVCLPAARGGWTARPGEAVDEERGERGYVAYAWPDAMTVGMHDAFFVDEHERILVSNNLEGKEPRYAGPNFPPPCDAALSESTRADWTPWKGKAPRRELPGDRGADSRR